MIKLKQTVFQSLENRGNSKTVCFAFLFNKKIKDCPEVQNISEQELVDWLENLGYELEKSNNDVYKRGDVEDGYYIAFGKSNREDEPFSHFVVMQKGEVILDPHPENTGLKEIHGYMYLEEIYETTPVESEPEKEKKEDSDPKEEVVHKKINKKINEDFLDKLGFVFLKRDAYTGRPLFKLVIEKTILAEVTITAQRLSSMIDTPDVDAWIFVYNEIGKGNSRLSKKVYFENDAFRFVENFKWINNVY